MQNRHHSISMPPEADWQMIKTCVSERIGHLLKSSLWSDCIFKVNHNLEQEFQVFSTHKVILASASPVFEAMLFGPLAEKDCIIVTDVKPSAFAAMLGYIYSDILKLKSVEEACDVIYVSKKYLIPNLENKCLEFLLSNLQPSNACYIHEFAEAVGEPVLASRSMEVICTHANEILRDISFHQISQRTVLSILKQNAMNLDSEIIVFRAVVEWSVAECKRNDLLPTVENQRAVLGEVLGKVRFLALSAEEFMEVEFSGLFTKDECEAIVNNMKASRQYSLPSSACDVAKERMNVPTRFSYCTRHTIKNCHNISGRNRLMTSVKVNQLVVVRGIRVSTKLPGQEIFAFKSPPFTYEEDMKVSVLHSNSVLSKTWFHEEVEYNTMVTVNFSEPLLFQRDLRYSIVIDLQGEYPMRFMSDLALSKNVKFNFGDYIHEGSPGTFVCNPFIGFIDGIVFSNDL